MRKLFATTFLAGMAMALCVPAIPAQAVEVVSVGENELLSKRADGESATGASVGQGVSADGRFVVFTSTADDLVAPSAYPQAYLLDRRTGEVELVSRTPSGAPGNRSTDYVAISANGRYVAFGSSSSDLGVDEPSAHVAAYLLDRSTGTVTLVSRTHKDVLTNGAYPTSVSDNGRYVVYETWSKNIVRRDRNRTRDVFMFDTVRERTIVVSRSIDGGTSDRYSASSTMSADGTQVAFSSSSSDITDDSDGGYHDIVLFDVATKTNQLLTRGNNSSFAEAISASGSHVTLTSHASNLVDGEVISGYHAYLIDVTTGDCVLVDQSSDGEVANRGPAGVWPSGDGSSVVFGSWSTNLVPETPYDTAQVYVRDVAAGTTELLSFTWQDETPANGRSVWPRLSAHGTYVVYTSEATDLVPADQDAFDAVIGHRLR